MLFKHFEINGERVILIVHGTSIVGDPFLALRSSRHIPIVLARGAQSGCHFWLTEDLSQHLNVDAFFGDTQAKVSSDWDWKRPFFEKNAQSSRRFLFQLAHVIEDFHAIGFTLNSYLHGKNGHDLLANPENGNLVLYNATNLDEDWTDGTIEANHVQERKDTDWNLFKKTALKVGALYLGGNKDIQYVKSHPPAFLLPFLAAPPIQIDADAMTGPFKTTPKEDFFNRAMDVKLAIFGWSNVLWRDKLAPDGLEAIRLLKADCVIAALDATPLVWIKELLAKNGISVKAVQHRSHVYQNPAVSKVPPKHVIWVDADEGWLESVNRVMKFQTFLVKGDEFVWDKVYEFEEGKEEEEEEEE